MKIQPKIIIRGIVVEVDGERRTFSVNERGEEVSEYDIQIDTLAGVTFDYADERIVIREPALPKDWPGRDGIVLWALRGYSREDVEDSCEVVGYVDELDEKWNGPHAAIAIYSRADGMWMVSARDTFLTRAERAFPVDERERLVDTRYNENHYYDSDAKFRTHAKARRVAREIVEKHYFGTCRKCFKARKARP